MRGTQIVIPHVRQAERDPDNLMPQLAFVADPILLGILGAGAGFAIGYARSGRWEQRWEQR